MGTPQNPTSGKSRLVVELASRVSDQLNDLTETEQCNKTVAVNKAIQLLHLFREIEAQNGSVVIHHADGRLERLKVLV